VTLSPALADRVTHFKPTSNMFNSSSQSPISLFFIVLAQLYFKDHKRVKVQHSKLSSTCGSDDSAVQAFAQVCGALRCRAQARSGNRLIRIRLAVSVSLYVSSDDGLFLIKLINSHLNQRQCTIS
jgi:hypothetical protein